MKLPKNEIEDLIRTRRFFNNNNGIDNFPGELLILDQDEILYEPNQIRKIILYAWFDKKDTRTRNYIISYAHNYLILDWFSETCQVYEFLINKYIIKD